MSVTISSLAKRFGLSRSALLYYDRLGLLKPSGRTLAGYRQYTGDDEATLAKICTFRDAGIPLRQIKSLLQESSSALARASLMAHLSELNTRILALKDQQTRVLKLMGMQQLPESPGQLNVEQMVRILRGAGLDDHGLERLHVFFERLNPDAHQNFLEGLGLSAAQIEEVRSRSRGRID